MIHLTAEELTEKLKNVPRYAQEYDELVRCKDGDWVSLDDVLQIFGFREVYKKHTGLIIKEI